MPINIYSVANHLSEQGWKLISDVYKNLNDELEMQCPNGHVNLISYGKWRKHPVCEKCRSGDSNKIIKDTIPRKANENVVRVLALDAATIITGYAIYDDGVLVHYGIYKINKDLPVEERINKVKKWLKKLIEEAEPSFLGLENIQLQNYQPNSQQMQVKTFQTLAQLQGVLIDTAFEACIDHDLVYSTTWRKYCNVGDEKGRESKKRAAQEKVKLWYNQDCTQDEADAICIGKYFCHKLKMRNTEWGEQLD